MTKEEFLQAFNNLGEKISNTLDGHVSEEKLQLFRNSIKAYEMSIGESDEDAYLHQLVMCFIQGTTLVKILESE